MLRCKGRDSLERKFTSRCTDRITDGKNTRVKNSDDISGIRFIYHMTGLCHHLLRLKKTHFLFALDMINFLRCVEFTGTDTHKCNSVSMSLVHICLDLEYKCREIIRHRIYFSLI